MKRILTLILIVTLAVSLIACSSGVKPNAGTDPKDSTPAAAAAIEMNLADLDKDLNVWGEIFQWSPKGDYAIFNAMSTKASDKAVVALLDAKNGKLTKLADGYLSPSISWSQDSKLVSFSIDSQLYLYNISEKNLGKIADKGYMPQFSPDGSKLIYMNEGLWLYDMSGKSASQISKGKYDAAPIWFSDGKRVFYYRDNGKNLGDGAGNEQVMSILDISTGKSTDINVDMKGKFKSARWLEQDHKLFINAGWDDGSFYHMLNLDNNELIKNVVPESMLINFDDAGKRVLITKDYSVSQVTVYDYDMKKLGAYSLYDDKEYPAATENFGISAFKGDSIVYLHTGQQESKGALMISYLSDGKQTRITEYGSYSVPSVSPDQKLIAYFENGSKLKIVPIESMKETEIEKQTSGKQAMNELLSMLPNTVGTEWIYNGFAEYGHSMRLDGINAVGEGKTEYLISGKVDDMSDGEAKGDFSIYLQYLVSKDGIRETINKGEKLPHKIKDFDILRYPLIKGNKWTQQVEINGQKVELQAEIIDVTLSQEKNKVLKVQYTANVKGMPKDTYKEVRTFEEGKGLTFFQNTFDKDIEFNYSLFQLRNR